jgi:hypothetical protein
MDHLVRGAAEDEPGQVTPASRAHDDRANVVGLGVVDDLAGGVAVQGVLNLPARLDPAWVSSATAASTLTWASSAVSVT